MRRINVFVCLLTLLLAGCKPDHATVNQAFVSPEEKKFSQSVGHEVVLQGPLNLDGKFGPYITVDKMQVYLLARGDDGIARLNSFMQKMAGQQNKQVRFSGVLRQQKEMRSSNPLISGIPEYYFMEYPGTQVSTLPP